MRWLFVSECLINAGFRYQGLETSISRLDKCHQLAIETVENNLPINYPFEDRGEAGFSNKPIEIKLSEWSI